MFRGPSKFVGGGSEGEWRRTLALFCCVGELIAALAMKRALDPRVAKRLPAVRIQ